MIEKELLEACKRRERKAVKELYRKCYASTFSICLRYQSDEQEAESVFHKAFMKLLNGLSTYKETRSFYHWLKRIVINANIDQFRKNRRVRELIDSREAPTDEELRIDIYEDHHLRFEEAELEAMVQALPPMTRKVFNLFAIDDYTHREIGEMLGISEGTSKWHLSSGRKKLREMLAQYEQKKKAVGHEK